jgi:hypothetical protein
MPPACRFASPLLHCPPRLAAAPASRPAAAAAIIPIKPVKATAGAAVAALGKEFT